MNKLPKLINDIIYRDYNQSTFYGSIGLEDKSSFLQLFLKSQKG